MDWCCSLFGAVCCGCLLSVVGCALRVICRLVCGMCSLLLLRGCDPLSMVVVRCVLIVVVVVVGVCCLLCVDVRFLFFCCCLLFWCMLVVV